MTTPKVSILIPTYNRPDFLPKAVESALRQDYPNLEVIVSDNASSTCLLPVLAPYLSDPRLKFYQQTENLGMGGNWRKCLYEYASGDWFMLLSDDDELLAPHYIRTVMENLTPRVVLAYADACIEHLHSGKQVELHLPFRGVVSGREVFLSRGTVLPQDFVLCNILFRRAEALQQGAFLDDLSLAMDTELFLRMCLLGDVYCLPEITALYRYHPGNLVASLSRHQHYLVNAVNAFIQALTVAAAQQVLSPAELHDWQQRNLQPLYENLLLIAQKHHPADYPRLASALQDKMQSAGFLQPCSLGFKWRLRLLQSTPRPLHKLYTRLKQLSR